MEDEIRHPCYCVGVCCCVRTDRTRCVVFGDMFLKTLDVNGCACLGVRVGVCVSVWVSVRVCVCVCVCVYVRYTRGTPREIFEIQFCECNSLNESWWMRFVE